MCVCTYMHACLHTQGTHALVNFVEIIGQLAELGSLLALTDFQEWNVGHQAQWQGLFLVSHLPVEPSSFVKVKA